MDYCEHCEGQRFDRARVLRALRQIRRHLGTGDRQDGDKALETALRAIRDLDIPHLDIIEELEEDEIIH